MNRVLSMLCVLAMVLGMICLPTYATQQDPDAAAAVCGENEYSSLQAAVDDYTSGVIVLQKDAQGVDIPLNVHLNTNGHDVAGVTVADGATLYVSDSRTDDYTVADGIYGTVTGISGNVQAAEGYVAINEEGAVSYHKADLTLTSMTLRPTVAGVYYNSTFAADEVVAARVETYGVALSVVEAPTAENLDTLCGYSTIYGFENGEKSGTLLTGIMTEGNTDFANGRNAAMEIYGSAYIQVDGQYVFGACASRSLQEQVELIDTVFDTLNATQQAAILALYTSYASVVSQWNVPNMKHAAPLGDTVITVPVKTENGEVTETVTVEQDGVTITIPFGTLVDGDELTLTVTRLDASESDIEAGEGQTLMPFDVHVEGISANNTQPLTVALGKVMPENLNMGNYTVYHVEENGTNEMELVANAEELSDHNQFVYTLDGELTLNMATFSEVAVVSENANDWKNGVDHSWYNTTDTTLYIRNADQLWSLSQIVGGMADGIVQDSFDGKIIKLLADINIGDMDSENGYVFYPIGYNCDDGSYEKTGVAVSTGFYSFMGTFDGNGNTISDFYQNTWEMKGDDEYYAASEQRFRDGMGLFGKIYGGTVKNLTVRNFQNDGEYTTTGVIAAYADGATFENIAIFNCNPRVYNIGNGGIVGCVGWYAKEADLKTTFTNITVDNTNKISALWGSWDVACGGILGQYYPISGQTSAGKPANGGVHFENCHVAAQIDVYNDVCANYQYYAYRYAGMLIGSVRENETIDGHVYPNLEGITAEDCTVHFGDWNDYYYCELVANTLASYTHDHQMSRLEQVLSVDVENKQIVTLEGETVDIPASGRANYVVVLQKDANNKWIHGDGDEYAECYHFVDGAVWNHADGGTETVDGVEGVLKEDKQHIYREFLQLFTGYGWGVTSKYVGEFDGVTILDREVADSVVKFEEAENAADSYTTGTTITIGELFGAKADLDEKVAIQEGKVQVTVSPATEGSTADGTYTANTTNWTQGKLTFTGIGTANITITDYYFCTPTTITVSVVLPPKWVAAWNVNPQYDSTNKVSTRTADDDGYYYVDLSVDGEIKEYKTNVDAAINYLDSCGTGTGQKAIAIYLCTESGTEFTSAKVATTVVGAKAAKLSTITAIDDDGTVTGTSSSYSGKVAEEGKIFDVSSNATEEGDITRLRVGDYGRFYTDANGDILYGYIYRRAEVDMNTVCDYADEMLPVFANGGVVEAECPVCLKTVTWNEMPATTSGSNLTLDAGHYYLASDVTVKGCHYIINSDVCIHLNGKTIKQNNIGNRCVFSANSGKLSVMGSGNVIGRRTAATDTSATQRCGSAMEMTTSAVVNLCGGTWSKNNDDLDVIGCRTSTKGGLNIYDGTVINIGQMEGNALWATGGKINLYGGEINGNVYVRNTCNQAGVNYDYNLNLVLAGTAVNGKVELDPDVDNTKTFSVTVSGDTEIDELVVPTGTTVQIGELTAGADINVNATGVFSDTVDAEIAQGYIDNGCIKIHSSLEGKVLAIVEGALAITDAPVEETPEA